MSLAVLSSREDTCVCTANAAGTVLLAIYTGSLIVLPREPDFALTVFAHGALQTRVTLGSDTNYVSLFETASLWSDLDDLAYDFVTDYHGVHG
jgi:hypothetical protein